MPTDASGQENQNLPNVEKGIFAKLKETATDKAHNLAESLKAHHGIWDRLIRGEEAKPREVIEKLGEKADIEIKAPEYQDELVVNGNGDRPIVVKPTLNPAGIFAEFARTPFGIYTLRQLEQQVDELHITPETNPRVAVLYAGRAPEITVFTDRGWREDEITCIDEYQPDVDTGEVSFLTWDLANLDMALTLRDRLPAEVLQVQHSFDVVTIMNGLNKAKRVKGERIIDFFLKPGGIGIFINETEGYTRRLGKTMDIPDYSFKPNTDPKQVLEK